MTTNTTTSRTTTTIYRNDSGVEFDLPVTDPYGSDPWELTATVRPTDGRTVITYVIADADGGSAWDGFSPDYWTGFNLTESVDVDAITECDECGQTYDHTSRAESSYYGDDLHAFEPTERARAIADGRSFVVVDHKIRDYDEIDNWSTVDLVEDLADDIESVRARSHVESVLSTYRTWANGEVFAVVTAEFDSATGEQIGDEDSCYGFIGDKHAEDTMKDDHAHAVYYGAIRAATALVTDGTLIVAPGLWVTVWNGEDAQGHADRRATVDHDGRRVYVQYL